MPRLALAQPVGLAVLVLVLARVSWSLAFFLALGGPGSVVAPAVDVLVGLVFDLTLAGLLSAFCHFALGLMGAMGQPQSLLWALLSGKAPLVLMAPGVLLARATLEVFPDGYVAVLSAVFLGLSAWAIILTVNLMGLRYNVSGAKALFAYLLAWGLSLLIVNACTGSLSLLLLGRFCYILTID